MNDARAIALHDGERGIERVLRPADHNRQLAVLGAGLAAGDGCIQHADAALAASGCQLAGDIGRHCAVVDIDGAFTHCRDRPVRPKRHLQHIRIVTDTGQHDVRPFGGGSRCRGMTAAMLLHPGLGLCGSAVVDGHIVTGGGDMSCHGIAHDPKPEKCDFRHSFQILLLPAISADCNYAPRYHGHDITAKKSRKIGSPCRVRK